MQQPRTWLTLQLEKHCFNLAVFLEEFDASPRIVDVDVDLGSAHSFITIWSWICGRPAISFLDNFVTSVELRFGHNLSETVLWSCVRQTIFLHQAIWGAAVHAPVDIFFAPGNLGVRRARPR